MTKKYEVVGVGHALVDILASVTEEGLAGYGLAKGGMTLIDKNQAASIYHSMAAQRQVSGGSAANTLAGLAQLGKKCAFIGKVAKDALGDVFAHDLQALGVDFRPIHGESFEEPTGRCYVLVTPDAQRTMGTCLGVSYYVESADFHGDMLEETRILYLEGYLWDQDHAKRVMREAIERTKSAGGEIAFTLSDSFCVHRHRQDFLELLNKDLNLLFANEDEALALMETTDFDKAMAELEARFPHVLIVITRSEKGCVALHGRQRTTVPAGVVEAVVDTTGAGDLFAAGFLSQYVAGGTIATAAAVGNDCAAKIIQQYGARLSNG